MKNSNWNNNSNYESEFVSLAEIKTKESHDLVKLWQKHKNKASYIELIDRYLIDCIKMTKYFINKYTYKQFILVEEIEIKNCALNALDRAINTFDSDKYENIQFTQYFLKILQWNTLKDIKMIFNLPKLKNLNAIYNKYSEKDYINSEVLDDFWQNKSQVISNYIAQDKPKFLKLWELRLQGKKMAEIASALKISVSQVKARNNYLKKIIIKKFGKNFLQL